MQIPLYSYKTGRTRTPRSYFTVFLALCVSALLWAGALAPAHAATSDVGGHGSLSWDASMIYAGQNNGSPWGPVGETAIVHGNGFPPIRKSLTLSLVAGDSSANPLLCSRPGVNVATVTVNGGQFSTGFFWPAAAGSLGQKYSICALAGPIVVSARDSNGPFTVLAGAPTLQASNSSIAAGNSVTVSGQNWVPAQPVTVVIGNCGDCVGAPSNTVITNTVSSSASGAFSVILFVPGSFAAGTYRINAYARRNASTGIALLDANHTTTLPQLTISSAAPTATPTVSPTVSPTDTTTATVTGTQIATKGGASTPNSGSQNNNALSPVLLLGALLPLLLTVIGLAIYLLRQRKKGPATTGRVLPSHSGRFQAYAVPDQAAYGFQAQSLPNANQFNNAPNEFAQQAWPQNYTNDTQQPNWPQNHAYGGQQNWPQRDPSVGLFDQTTVSDVRPYGALCFKCSTPLPMGSQVCGNCGTDNGEFFAQDHY